MGYDGPMDHDGSMGQWVNGSMGHDGSMGQDGSWVNGSWVTYTMGQMGHGSRKVTHGPLFVLSVFLLTNQNTTYRLLDKVRRDHENLFVLSVNSY